MSIFNKNSEAIFDTISNSSGVKYYSFFSRICIFAQLGKNFDSEYELFYELLFDFFP